jgi:hypothetical protein
MHILIYIPLLFQRNPPDHDKCFDDKNIVILLAALMIEELGQIYLK